MGRIGPLGIWELLIILLVVLLIFGARRLPELARGIGQSVREFRNGVKEFHGEVEEDPYSNSAGRQTANRGAQQDVDALSSEIPATTKS